MFLSNWFFKSYKDPPVSPHYFSRKETLIWGSCVSLTDSITHHTSFLTFGVYQAVNFYHIFIYYHSMRPQKKKESLAPASQQGVATNLTLPTHRAFQREKKNWLTLTYWHSQHYPPSNFRCDIFCMGWSSMTSSKLFTPNPQNDYIFKKTSIWQWQGFPFCANIEFLLIQKCYK